MTLDKLEKQQHFSSILVRDVLTDLIQSRAKVTKAGPKSITKWQRKMSESIVRNVSRSSKHIFGSGEKEIRKEIQRLKANIDSQLSKLRNNLEASVASCCKPIIPDELPVSRISSEKHSLVPMLKAKREKVLEQMTNLTDKILTLKENMDSQRLILMDLLKAARIQLQQSRVSDSSSSSAAAAEQPSALQRTAEHLNRR